MKLILAQGNPGKEYVSTRHNVGFLVIDALQEQLGAKDFQNKTKFQALTSEVVIGGEKVILAKPTTFYNLTGQSARAICDFYKINPTDILVIHDELALNFGTIRVRQNGSDAGNKGIRSLNSHLGPNFWRIRIGINNELASKIDSADFVLSKFSEQEKKTLNDSIVPEVLTLSKFFLDNNLEQTSKRT